MSQHLAYVSRCHGNVKKLWPNGCAHTHRMLAITLCTGERQYAAHAGKSYDCMICVATCYRMG